MIAKNNFEEFFAEEERTGYIDESMITVWAVFGGSLLCQDKFRWFVLFRKESSSAGHGNNVDKSDFYKTRIETWKQCQ